MAIYKRGGMWWIDCYVGSGEHRRRMRMSTGTSDETQARIIEQAKVAVNRGLTTRQRAMAIIDNVLPEVSQGLPLKEMRPYWESCVEAEGIRISKKERGQRMSQLDNLAVWLTKNTRALCVTDVGNTEAFAYGEAYQKITGCKAKSRNNAIAHLSAAWNIFMKHGKAVVNPWRFGRAAHNPDEEQHGRPFTDEEIERILAVCDEVGHEWRGVVIVGLYTGLREGDVSGLTWGDVNLERGVIETIPGKTAKKRIKVHIPMHPKVIAVLRSALEANRDPIKGSRQAEAGAAPSEHVFPWRAKHPSNFTRSDGDVYFSDITERAGVKANRPDEYISYHCLRHTFVSRLQAAGVSREVRMQLAGHTNEATHAIYAHDDTQARAAIGKLA